MGTFPPGSALLLYNHGQQSHEHVWFVLTDPDPQGKVLAVMLCTRRRHSDSTTIFVPGEYPFGAVPTEGVIDYGVTRLFPESVLIGWLTSGNATSKPSLSAAQLKRVLEGLKASGHVPNWVGPYLDP